MDFQRPCQVQTPVTATSPKVIKPTSPTGEKDGHPRSVQSRSLRRIKMPDYLTPYVLVNHVKKTPEERRKSANERRQEADERRRLAELRRSIGELRRTAKEERRKASEEKSKIRPLTLDQLLNKRVHEVKQAIGMRKFLLKKNWYIEVKAEIAEYKKNLKQKPLAKAKQRSPPNSVQVSEVSHIKNNRSHMIPDNTQSFEATGKLSGACKKHDGKKRLPPPKPKKICLKDKGKFSESVMHKDGVSLHNGPKYEIIGGYKGGNLLKYPQTRSDTANKIPPPNMKWSQDQQHLYEMSANVKAEFDNSKMQNVSKAVVPSGNFIKQEQMINYPKATQNPTNRIPSPKKRLLEDQIHPFGFNFKQEPQDDIEIQTLSKDVHPRVDKENEIKYSQIQVDKANKLTSSKGSVLEDTSHTEELNGKIEPKFEIEVSNVSKYLLPRSTDNIIKEERNFDCSPTLSNTVDEMFSLIKSCDEVQKHSNNVDIKVEPVYDMQIPNVSKDRYTNRCDLVEVEKKLNCSQTPTNEINKFSSPKRCLEDPKHPIKVDIKIEPGYDLEMPSISKDVLPKVGIFLEEKNMLKYSRTPSYTENEMYQLKRRRLEDQMHPLELNVKLEPMSDIDMLSVSNQKYESDFVRQKQTHPNSDNTIPSLNKKCSENCRRSSVTVKEEIIGKKEMSNEYKDKTPGIPGDFDKKDNKLNYSIMSPTVTVKLEPKDEKDIQKLRPDLRPDLDHLDCGKETSKLNQSPLSSTVNAKLECVNEMRNPNIYIDVAPRFYFNLDKGNKMQKVRNSPSAVTVQLGPKHEVEMPNMFIEMPEHISMMQNISLEVVHRNNNDYGKEEVKQKFTVCEQGRKPHSCQQHSDTRFAQVDKTEYKILSNGMDSKYDSGLIKKPNDNEMYTLNNNVKREKNNPIEGDAYSKYGTECDIIFDKNGSIKGEKCDFKQIEDDSLKDVKQEPIWAFVDEYGICTTAHKD